MTLVNFRSALFEGNGNISIVCFQWNDFKVFCHRLIMCHSKYFLTTTASFSYPFRPPPVVNLSFGKVSLISFSLHWYMC